MIKLIIISYLLFCTSVYTFANTQIVNNPADSCITPPVSKENKLANPYRFNWKQLILPTALITGASAVLCSGWVGNRNIEIRDGLQNNKSCSLKADDYLQYAPLVGIYGLELCGVKGTNSYIDKTIILATAALLTTAMVNTLKAAVNVTRPDGSSSNSFPSGHTATAFMGAELLRREYPSNIWIGVGGYTVATLTAYLRMYNNRHWLTDVIAGAGFGILSAEAAYWLYPIITKTFFKKIYSKNIYISPSVGNGQYALHASFSF